MARRTRRSARSSSRSGQERVGRAATSWADGLEQRLPRRVRRLLQQARGNDLFLLSAGLAFYALVSLVPLVILIMWVASLILGDQRLHHLADVVGRATPKNLGADQALRRVAEIGSQVGWVSILTALWPATAYGAGLERALQRLSPRRDTEFAGLRGRALLLLVLLPVLIMGSLLGSYAGTTLLGDGVISRILGWGVALVTGFVGSAVGTAILLKIFPPERLSWRQIAMGTAVTSAGVSLLSVLVVIYVSSGANFEEHYATSGVAGVVFLGLWLFLSNVMLLIGYRFALRV